MAAKSCAATFVEDRYIQHWTFQAHEWKPSVSQLNTPVTNVFWFAAQAYCQVNNKSLPTVSQWERVASASESLANGAEEKNDKQRILRLVHTAK